VTEVTLVIQACLEFQVFRDQKAIKEIWVNLDLSVNLVYQAQKEDLANKVQEERKEI
jgi:hypothetical protein